MTPDTDYTLYHYRFKSVGFCGEQRPTQHAFVWAHDDAPRQAVDEAASDRVSIGSVSTVEVHRSEVEPAVVEPAEPVSA